MKTRKYLLALSTTQGPVLVLNPHTQEVFTADTVDEVIYFAFGESPTRLPSYSPDDEPIGVLTQWNITDLKPCVIKLNHYEELIKGFIASDQVVHLRSVDDLLAGGVDVVMAKPSIARLKVLDISTYPKGVVDRPKDKWHYI